MECNYLQALAEDDFFPLAFADVLQEDFADAFEDILDVASLLASALALFAAFFLPNIVLPPFFKANIAL